MEKESDGRIYDLGAGRDFVITGLYLSPVCDIKMDFERCKDMAEPRQRHSPCCDGMCCKDGGTTPGSTGSRVLIWKTGQV